MRKARFDIISDHVHNYYLTLSQKAVGRMQNTPDLHVLKTDAWNELPGALPVGGIAPQLNVDCKIVEVQKEVCEAAQKHHPELHITKGDIRDLPYQDKEFHIILDLSTLDHIPESDVPLAIESYARVLKNNGLFLLVTWFKDKVEEQTAEWSPDNQYYFNYDKVLNIINKLFRLEEQETLYSEKERFLHYFLFTKK